MKRLLPLAFVLAAACTPPPPPPPPAAPPAPDPVEVRRVIDEANARAAAAIIKGDVATATSIYADDAVTMMPNAPKAVGKAAISEMFTALSKEMTVKSVTFRTDEVILGGDLAVEIGGFQMTVVPKKGPEIKDTGKYITVWKKQADGSWKVIRDINNSDGPPPTK